MTERDGVLHPSLVEIIGRVRVSDDRCGARVGNREIATDTPRELQARLADTIYEIFHAGRSGHEGGEQERSHELRRRDPVFERELVAAVPHSLIRVPVRLLGSREQRKEGTFELVEREGLRVWAPVELLDLSEGTPPGEQVDLSAPSARASLSPGFLMVRGERGLERRQGLSRTYVHVNSADAAVGVWGKVLARLNGSGVAYQAKILSRPAFYPRRDALVVYADEWASEVEEMVAAETEGMPGVVDETPALCRRVGPGVAAAEEPVDGRSAYQGMSFGMHRASLVAEALNRAARNSSGIREAILEVFEKGNANPSRPYQNLRTQ
ncbi:T3SS effector HopA1 family protein [Nocardiopsis sp. CC223A]|uniref:T3SS effector HopA1 family protein n=1 Tax=Nocardiopsis sp. CC223A TaxID=3044051 RepID=UPI00278C30CF|nr:T3SS effector HopA1 family protein [Nocardiopsis sp. CC223A]